MTIMLGLSKLGYNKTPISHSIENITDTNDTRDKS